MYETQIEKDRRIPYYDIKLKSGRTDYTRKLQGIKGYS